MSCNLPRETIRFEARKKHTSLRTLNPDDASEALNFTGTVEFELLRDGLRNDVRIIGNGGGPYDPELALFTGKEYASAAAPAKVGAHHLEFDWAHSDAGAQAFWDEGREYLLIIKSGSVGSKTYTNEPLKWIAVDYELADLGQAPGVILETKVASVVDTLQFAVEDGRTANDFYNGHRIRLVSAANPADVSEGVIENWVGGTKTIQLDEAALSVAVGDFVTIYSDEQGPFTNQLIHANFKDNSVDRYYVCLHRDLHALAHATAGLSVEIGVTKLNNNTVVQAYTAASAVSNSKSTWKLELGGGQRIAVNESVEVKARVTIDQKQIEYARPFQNYP